MASAVSAVLLAGKRFRSWKDACAFLEESAKENVKKPATGGYAIHALLLHASSASSCSQIEGGVTSNG
jgi:hypothetical protein